MNRNTEAIVYCKPRELHLKLRIKLYQNVKTLSKRLEYTYNVKRTVLTDLKLNFISTG